MTLANSIKKIFLGQRFFVKNTILFAVLVKNAYFYDQINIHINFTKNLRILVVLT